MNTSLDNHGKIRNGFSSKFAKSLALLVFSTFMLQFITSCQKDEQGPDIAGNCAGTYSGILTSSDAFAPAKCIISREDNATISLVVAIGTEAVMLSGIPVTCGENGSVCWDIQEENTTFQGEIAESKLLWTLTGDEDSFVFTGAKMKSEAANVYSESYTCPADLLKYLKSR